MKEFRLGSRAIGDAHPPLVIAEIGITALWLTYGWLASATNFSAA